MLTELLRLAEKEPLVIALLCLFVVLITPLIVLPLSKPLIRKWVQQQGVKAVGLSDEAHRNALRVPRIEDDVKRLQTDVEALKALQGKTVTDMEVVKTMVADIKEDMRDLKEFVGDRLDDLFKALSR